MRQLLSSLPTQTRFHYSIKSEGFSLQDQSMSEHLQNERLLHTAQAQLSFHCSFPHFLGISTAQTTPHCLLLSTSSSLLPSRVVSVCPSVHPFTHVAAEPPWVVHAGSGPDQLTQVTPSPGHWYRCVEEEDEAALLDLEQMPNFGKGLDLRKAAEEAFEVKDVFNSTLDSEAIKQTLYRQAKNQVGISRTFS